MAFNFTPKWVQSPIVTCPLCGGDAPLVDCIRVEHMVGEEVFECWLHGEFGFERIDYDWIKPVKGIDGELEMRHTIGPRVIWREDPRATAAAVRRQMRYGMAAVEREIEQLLLTLGP